MLCVCQCLTCLSKDYCFNWFWTKIGKESYDEWNKVFRKNFWSVVNIVKESQKVLIKSKGNIVCISSICGLEVISDAPATYSTAKSALNTYIKCMSHFFGKYQWTFAILSFP